MSDVNQIKNIVIVGGGSAGWMTAAMLSKQLSSNINITLVESDEISTVGVGEATIPPIRAFNAKLEIDEAEFVSYCNGSFKLGISFENWGRKKDQYFHPFGRYAVDFDYIPFPYFWNKQRVAGNKRPLQDYSSAWQLAKHDKFSIPSTDKESLFSCFDYAYHFDAGLYASFLQNYANNRGVNRQEGTIVNVDTHKENGFIKSVTLASGKEIAGDLFIDCSGGRALLLGDTLGVKFIDWSEHLLCDRAVAVQTSHIKPISPYTRSIAGDFGWQWRIPLQTRMGNGLVYSSEFMSEQTAIEELITNVDGKVLTEPKPIKFKVGRRENFWSKNCVAIGLSAGFLEPLESTSLHLIQSAIMRLVDLFPNKNCDEVNTNLFNKQTINEYEHTRDFIILHYKATKRDDSEFWQYCQHMTVPDSLQNQIDLFSTHGHLDISHKDLFKHENWLAVLTGQRIYPKEVAPILHYKQAVDLKGALDSVQSSMEQIVKQVPTHQDFIKKHCQFVQK